MSYDRDKEKSITFRLERDAYIKLLCHAEDNGLSDVSKLLRLIIKDWLKANPLTDKTMEDIL